MYMYITCKPIVAGQKSVCDFNKIKTTNYVYMYICTVHDDQMKYMRINMYMYSTSDMSVHVHVHV